MTALDPATETLAADFITAVEQGDIETIAARIYAPDVVIWHNTDGLEMTAEQNYRTLRWLVATLKPFRYEEIVREPIPCGYAQRHTLRGTAPGGQQLEIRACFFVTVAGGRITRLDEYLDSRAGAALDPYRPAVAR